MVRNLVFITGASSGIGHALAQTVPFPDARLIDISRRGAEGIEHFRADLADPDSWSRVAELFARELRGFDGERVVCVQSAGTLQPMGFAGEVDVDGYARNVLLNSAAPQTVGAAFLDAPPPDLSPTEANRYAVEHSLAGRAGLAIEPLIAPLGFDWKIGVGLIASLAAREVIVATLAQVYASADEEGSLRAAIVADVDPRTGRRVFTPASVASLLVFFVFALQCMSTLAIMRRETNSWRWPAFAFGYMLTLAYGASFATYRIVLALGG